MSNFVIYYFIHFAIHFGKAILLQTSAIVWKFYRCWKWMFNCSKSQVSYKFFNPITIPVKYLLIIHKLKSVNKVYSSSKCKVDSELFSHVFNINPSFIPQSLSEIPLFEILIRSSWSAKCNNVISYCNFSLTLRRNLRLKNLS